MDQNVGPNATPSIFHESAQKLQQLVVEGKQMVVDGLHEDDMDSNASYRSAMTGLGASDESCSLLERLECDISRLQRLSFQIRLALYEIEAENEDEVGLYTL
jgi:hypothetical protein